MLVYKVSISYRRIGDKMQIALSRVPATFQGGEKEWEERIGCFKDILWRVKLLFQNVKQHPLTHLQASIIIGLINFLLFFSVVHSMLLVTAVFTLELSHH